MPPRRARISARTSRARSIAWDRSATCRSSLSGSVRGAVVPGTDAVESLERDAQRIRAAVADLSAYLLAAVLVTGGGNSPVSAAVDALDPSAAGAGARWTDLHTEWIWWNHLRTLGSIGGTAALVLALRPPGQRSPTDSGRRRW